MHRLFFWQSWQYPFRVTFWLLMMVFFLLCIIVPVLHLMGPEHLIEWHVFTYQSSFADEFSTFSLGPFNFSMTGYKATLTEEFGGGQMPVSTTAVKLLLIIITVCLLLYLTLVTIFKRFWYLVAMGGLLVFLIFFHIESVQIFNWGGSKPLILVFVLLLTPSYYLHAFNTNASFIRRLWVMSLTLLALGGLLFFYSGTSEPFSTLMHFGILAPYILIIIFIISVAHEIIAAFVNVITSTSGIANTVKIRHFIILSLIYLANILISFLYVAHYIDWQLIYINPFFLLIISSILGLWGSSSKATLYSGASAQEAIWSILYIIIAIVSLATIAVFLISLNDPLIKVIGDIIIYAHLAVGISFLLYILYNFIPLIEEGYEIEKIIYNPTNLPFITFRLMSVMIIIGLFAIRGFDYPVWYSLGGYDNSKADLMMAKGLPEVAESYYSTGASYAYRNHKSYYSLAMMALENDPKRATEYFAQVIDQRVSAQSTLNWANLQNKSQDYYKALFTLQEGYTRLSGNTHLLNNLAVQFEKLKLPDSALYYYLAAGTGNQQINNNRIALSAKYKISLSSDSVKIFKNLNRAGVANTTALGFQSSLPEMEDANHMYDMVLLNNWLLTNSPQVSDGSLAMTKTIIDSTSNQDYKDQLLYSWSLAAFNAGKVSQAIEGLLELSYKSSAWSERTTDALSNIFLQVGAFEQVTEILAALDHDEISLEEAVAFLENGYLDETKSFWVEAVDSDNKFLSALASNLLVAVFAEDPVLETDYHKYLNARYRRFYNDFYDEIKILSTINDQALKIDLALDLASFYHDRGNVAGSSSMLELIEKLELNEAQLRKFIILKALNNKESDNVQKQLVLFDSLYSFGEHEYLLENTLNHLAGLQLDSLSYLQMAEDNVYFVDAVLLGSSHFKDDIDPFKSYTLLANATRKNPGSPVLLEAYIFKALEVGLEEFANDALYTYKQSFSSSSYQRLKVGYDIKMDKIDSLLNLELNQ